MSIKPYILGQVIARGGMAEVYRGLQVGQDGFKRLVAIKRILPHHAQNIEFTEMFKDEAHIGQRLQHANIARVEGFDIIEGSAAIIMEFVDGSDIRTLLSASESSKNPFGKKTFLPSELCLYVIAEAARGLHYAHTRRDDITAKPLNIVHRDMSPQNLLISWDGEIKVTDFGIASADRDFKMTETKAGIVKGKYSYMSPEQISGKKCDARTDIFALCIVLWEMLTLKRLFTAENEIDVIEMVRHCRIPSRMRESNPSVSDELEDLVLRGLNKDPRKRYDSMDHFDRTIRSYLAKHAPGYSAQDVGAFVKKMLSDRREKSQEEIRKILTIESSSVREPSPHQSNGPAQNNLELALETNSKATTSTFTVGRHKNTPTTSFPLSKPIAGSSQNRGYTPYTTNLPNRRSKPKNKGPSTAAIAWVAAISMICIAGALYFKNYRNAAKLALTISVRSNPQTTKIKINDRDYAGGKYVTSPVKIKLDPGLNSIDFIRSGYKTETVLINTDDGIPKNPPSVRLKSTSIFAPVRIEYRGTEPVLISVNEGFAKQIVSPQASMFDITDIASGAASELSVIGPNRKPLFHCNFTPLNSTERRPLTILVDVTKGACEILGRGNKGEHP